MNGHTRALPPPLPAPHLPHNGADQLALGGRIHSALPVGLGYALGATCHSCGCLPSSCPPAGLNYASLAGRLAAAAATTAGAAAATAGAPSGSADQAPTAHQLHGRARALGHRSGRRRRLSAARPAGSSRDDPLVHCGGTASGSDQAGGRSPAHLRLHGTHLQGMCHFAAPPAAPHSAVVL